MLFFQQKKIIYVSFAILFFILFVLVIGLIKLKDNLPFIRKPSAALSLPAQYLSINNLDFNVILVKPTGEKEYKTYSKNELEKIFIGSDPYSVANYYKNVTYGKINLTASVTDWIDFDFTNINKDEDVYCDEDNMLQFFVDAKKIKKYFSRFMTKKYQFFLIQYPIRCKVLKTGKTLNVQAMNSSNRLISAAIIENIIISKDEFKFNTIHEIGHILGFGHSGAYTTKSNFLAYGDKYDVLGHYYEMGKFGGINIIHLLNSGIINNNQIKTMSPEQGKTQVVTIGYINDNKRGEKYLGAAAITYSSMYDITHTYVECRKPFTYNYFSDFKGAPVLLIHRLYPSLSKCSLGNIFSGMKCTDLQHQNTSDSNSKYFVAPGGYYFDDKKKMRIDFKSYNAQGCDISVNYNSNIP